MPEPVTFYTRVGAAAQAGAPIGASVDIARTATDNEQAAMAGRAFGVVGGAFQTRPQPGAAMPAQPVSGPFRAMPGVNPGPPPLTASQKDGHTFWDQVGGLWSRVTQPVIHALEWGTTATGNIAEADIRSWAEVGAQQRAGDFSGVLPALGRQMLGISRLWDSDWQEQWDKAVDADASVMQTLWLTTEDQLAALGVIEPGTSGSGIYDPRTQTYGPRVTSGGLDLLDDPDRRGERAEYFSEGAAHWTTGVGDALWQVFMDPLVVAGKAGAAVKTARATLDATDVARAADASIEAADLTRKQARARDLVRELAESFEGVENTAGAVTALARSRYLRNSTDGGAIAYFMSRAGEGIDDAAERIATREDVLYAGMGDAEALARLGQRKQTLTLELEKMLAKTSDIDASDILARADLDDVDALGGAYARLNDSGLPAREIEVQIPLIRKELDALERVMNVGAPIRGEGLTAPMAGELAMLPSGLSDLIPGMKTVAQRDVARVAKTIQNGPALEPIHLVTGRYLPGTFRVSDADAGTVVHAAIERARMVMKGLDREAYDEYNTALLQLEDAFLAAGTGAAAKAPRTLILDQFDRLVDEVIAHKYGLDKDQVAAVHSKMRKRRNLDLRNITTRIYKAREAGAPAVVNTGDGLYAFAEGSVPVLRSQLEDWASIVDPRQLDKFAAANFRNGLEGFVRKVETSGKWEATEALLGVSNRLWKTAALLRPYAYFVRSQVDTQLRMMAKLGALKYSALATRGVGNTIWNLRKVDPAAARAYQEKFSLFKARDDIDTELAAAGFDPQRAPRTPKQQIAPLQSRLDEVKAERRNLSFNTTHEASRAQAKLAEIDAKLDALGPRAVKTRERLEAQRARLEEGAAAARRATELDDEIRELAAQIEDLKGFPADRITRLRDARDAIEERIANFPEVVSTGGKKVRARNTAMARHVGMSAGFDRKGNWRSGKVTDAYQLPEDVARELSRFDANDSVLKLLTGGTRNELDNLRRSGKWDLIHGGDEQWERAYLRSVNHQIRSDAVGRLIIEGRDDAFIINWMRTDPAGRAYLRDMRAAGSGKAEVMVARMREHVDTLAPAGTPVRQALVERNVTLDDIKNTWQVGADRPLVPGELLSTQLMPTLVRKYEALEQKYFNWVAAMPENMMGRHPFYAARFEGHAKQALARAGVKDESALSLAQINEIRRFAASKARQDVARYMFDTSKQTNIAHTLRFLSPFYSAWEDTMTKWARIFGEDPSLIPMMWKVARSPNAAGWIVDENGRTITVEGDVIDPVTGEVVGKAGIMDGYVLVPGSLWDPTGKLREWTGAEDLRIAKNAANVVFQGDPWFLPGPGPIMAIPTNEILVRAFPEWWADEGESPDLGQAILRYILPYGPTSDSILEQALPSWARAATDALSQDGRRLDQVFTTLYQEQVNAERNGTSEPMTDDKRLDVVAKRTRNWAFLRLFGTQMPFTFTPQSRLAYYKSEYDRYRREYGIEAEERFTQDYPEFYEMAISLSANETGLMANESWGDIQPYRNDMAKHPEYGWFWAGASNLAGGFNAAVYHAQLRQTVGPGTSTTFRSRKDPLEAARENNIDQGWREYQQVNMALRLKLEERGLTSFTAEGASDLQAVRQAFIADLKGRNFDWASEYGDGGNNAGRVAEFLSLAVEQFEAHPELTERGDGQALMGYIAVREAIKRVMFERGTRSIEAQSNADLKLVWDQFTAGLIESDLGFEQAWNRVLEHDDLTGDLYGGSVLGERNDA